MYTHGYMCCHREAVRRSCCHCIYVLTSCVLRHRMKVRVQSLICPFFPPPFFSNHISPPPPPPSPPPPPHLFHLPLQHTLIVCILSRLQAFLSQWTMPTHCSGSVSRSGLPSRPPQPGTCPVDRSYGALYPKQHQYQAVSQVQGAHREER